VLTQHPNNNNNNNNCIHGSFEGASICKRVILPILDFKLVLSVDIDFKDNDANDE
jgi:hypothetical protein